MEDVIHFWYKVKTPKQDHATTRILHLMHKRRHTHIHTHLCAYNPAHSTHQIHTLVRRQDFV
jgi:hypothetical protein